MSKIKNLSLLNQWNFNKELCCLEKKFEFKSYLKIISFVNAIAWIANSKNHHPDIIVKYNYCLVQIMTHDEAAITEKDFELALAIDQLPT